jgi:hypothetical protein
MHSVAQRPDYFIAQHLAADQSEDASYYIVEIDDGVNLFLKELPGFHFTRRLSNRFFIIPENQIATLSPHVKVIGSLDNKWKISSSIKKKAGNSKGNYAISFRDEISLDALQSSIDIKVLRKHKRSRSAIVEVLKSKAFDELVNDPTVVFVSEYASPTEETPNNFQDISVNKINAVHAKTGLSGNGMVISIKEKNIDPGDIDLVNRILPSPIAADEVSLHATQIATIAAGAGNSIPKSRGSAFESKILSSSFDNLLPDDASILKANNVSVQNHSYGTAVENFYGVEASAYDADIRSDSTLVHVFSSGNSGSLAGQGVYDGIVGYANLTGNMKMAKNVVVTGAHLEDMSVDSRSSRGPAYDGRLKPDVSALGIEGTSDAAAVVSGFAILLQQAYENKYHVLPTSDLVRGAMMVTADDIDVPGPDYVTGYGALNALKATRLINNNQFFHGQIHESGLQHFEISVPPNISKLRVALTWNDPAANAGDNKALVNDLDLKVTDTGTGKIYLPWVLSTFPNADSLAKPARRSSDHLNNTEVAAIENPSSGIYSVFISSNGLQSPQSFNIVYWLDSTDVFEWTYPTNIDALDTTHQTFLRWNSTFQTVGKLSLSKNGAPFEPIDATVDLAKGFYPWNPPIDPGSYRLQMEVQGHIFTSDAFGISAPQEITVQYNCPDDAMISWDVVDSATTYNLYQLGTYVFELITTVADTAYRIENVVLTSPYFAVAPVFENHEGSRSAAYNIEAQGVNCYYVNFISQVSGSSGILALNLSTIYNVDEIRWQKRVNGEFVDIGSNKVSSSLHSTFTDSNLSSGISEYRAVIVTKDGRQIETESSSLYFASESEFIFYPNPINKGDELNVISNTGGTIYFYNSFGALVKSQEILVSPLFKFSVDGLASGLYFYSVKKNNKSVSDGKIFLR